ncbi:hypothetical protein P3X46_002550 [Hevea brasiliensis]|uniref:Cystatin domain-containing protein n=1 Tax=Hevea brasiliensis TaxID=3981 RepID=A0ABQ9N3C1_HEVBR|nr:cysteine proteinase inhibitor B [Hevea brasiliensis]KAJ9187054.1 hypothetical protein P3X46_002550 [Hevea brasiliensis]
MAKVELLLLLLLHIHLLLSAFLLVSVSARGGLIGGLQPVEDVKSNQEVQEIGRFSVEEFNKQLRNQGNGGEELIFSEVVEAQMQVVKGIMYYLKIEATTTRSRETGIYDSKVATQPWLHQRKLVRFQPSMQLRIRKL